MSTCHTVQQDEKVLKKQNKILLMGNPNVGKSVFFTELTGIHAVSSNYAGTTVSYMEGSFKAGKNEYTIIDVPGTYSLTPANEAEAVATNFMESGAKALVCVLDASNLERNLRLALELRQCTIPTVYALNMIDVAARNGISINEKLLEQELGSPVVPAVAVKRQGIDELVKQLESALGSPERADGETCCGACPNKQHNQDDIWAKAREIVRRVSGKSAVKMSFADRLGENMIKPFPGIPIAFLALTLLIGVVVGGGRGLRAGLIPLVDGLIVPFFRNVFERIFAFFIQEGGHLCYRYLYWGAEGFATAVRTVTGSGYDVSCGAACVLLNISIGEYGIFVISFQWIIALILPYVFSFYLGISFLEDSGYLPRVSVLFDNIMRKLGVQGGSLIHVFLAFGCAVPAIIGSRTATTRKERLVIAAVICFAIPCISQIGALIALMSAFSWWMPLLMLLFALLLFVATALVAGKVIKGKVDPLILEVPNLLVPEPKAYFRKLMIRMKHFMVEAEIPMLAAVFFAAVLAGTGVLNLIAVYAQPVVSGWLGMPPEAVVALILGIVRREMSVAPLLALNLTYLQAFIAGVVSLMYLPCMSVFGVLAKEFKIRVAIVIFAGTVSLALFTGGLINHIVRLFL